MSSLQFNTWGSASSSPPISTRLRSNDKQENNPTKSINGIWTVYFSNFAKEQQGQSSNFNEPRYEMRIKRIGDMLAGNCILNSGPNAFEFVISGQISKDKSIHYNIKSINHDFWVKASYDGNNIIKDGMWYRDKQCRKKGGILVAIRKGSGTKLSSSLIPKPIKPLIPIQFVTKSSNPRKRKLSIDKDTSSRHKNKKRKRSRDDIIEDLAKNVKPPSSYTCFNCDKEDGLKWKTTHFDNIRLLRCLTCYVLCHFYCIFIC